MMKNYVLQGIKDLSKVAMLLALTGFSAHTYAQTASIYRITNSLETYVPITDPDESEIVAVSVTNKSIDDEFHILPEQTIPFPFTIGGNTYTGLRIFENGFIGFGENGSKTNTPFTMSNGSAFIMAPYAKDLVGLYRPDQGIVGNIVYETRGEAPNRQFVIQYSNMVPYNSSTPNYPTNIFILNFQIILNEDNTVKFVYNIVPDGTPSQQELHVGVRGATTSDYHTRTSAGTEASNWSSTTKGLTNSNKMTLNTGAGMVPSGFTFNILLPLPCEAPTAQPTNLQLTSTSLVINGTFQAASPAADKYLVLRTPSGFTPSEPMDTQNYPVGVSSDLSAYVVYNGTNTSFTDVYANGVRGNTTYDYYVYAVNSNCGNGPTYLALNPATATITNCPSTFGNTDIRVVEVTTDALILAWPATTNSTATLLNSQIEVATDANFENHVEGSPFNFYDGELQLELYNLNANTRYYYRGKYISEQCESEYSNVSNVYTQCISVDNFDENFDTAGSATMPNCWSTIISSVTSSKPSIAVSSSYKNSAPYGISIYSGGADLTNLDNKAILVSPMLNNITAGTHRLRFQARLTAATHTHAIQVVALSDNTEDAYIEVIATIPHTDLSNTYREFIVEFNDYAGSAAHVGIRRINGATYQYLAIDDISWEPIPSCPELGTFQVSEITPVGATISFDDDNGAPELGYQYAVSNNAAPSEDMAIISTFDQTFTIDNVADGTHYVFVRRVCGENDFSTWKTTSFKTIVSARAPWQEDFMTASSTTATYGWDNTDTYISGVRAGVIGIGASENVIFKNLDNNRTSAKFSTIAVGPLNASNYEFSFNYKQTAYAAPYAPLTTWGFITVEVSKDFGTTWTLLETITDQAPTTDYILKKYNLSAYEGEYVKFRITGNRTEGDFNLAFDVFKIAQPAVTMTCEAVATFAETFQDFTYFPENCWTASTATSVRIDKTIEGNNTLAIDLNNNVTENYIITPELSTIDGEHVLSFDGIQVPEGVIFQIGTITAPNNVGSFVAFGEPFALVAGEHFTSAAIPSTANHKHIAINVMGTGARESIILDNITWKSTLSTQDFELNSLRLYPNPATTVLNLQTTLEIKAMEVYTMTGQLVAKSASKQINVENLQAGVYVVKIATENGASKAMKFVKK